MARFSIKYGEQGRLANTDFVAGQILVTTDSRAIYVDKPNGSTKADRIRIGDFQVVDFLDATDKGESEGTVLPDPSTAGTQLYFVKSVNALAIAKGDAWIQLNPDTGATGVTVVGTGAEGAIRAGDVITSASYNPSTRTITFTTSRVTAANVDRGSSNVNDDLSAVEGRLTILEGSGAGSVAKAVSDAIGALDTTNDVTIASKDNSGVVTIKAGVKEVDGVIAQGTGADITLAKVATTGDGDDVVYKVGTGGAADITVSDALDTLNGSNTTAGSVAKAVKDAVDALDVTEFALAEKDGSTNVVTIHGAKEIDGKIGVGTTAANDITLAAVAATGAASDVSYSQTIGSTAVTNVDDALDALVTQTAGGVASKTIWFTDSSAGQSDYAKVFKIYQGANAPDDATAPASLVGTINIPKDKVLQDADIVTITFSENKLYDGVTDVTALIVGSEVPTAADAGKYLKMEMQNVTDPLYVNLQTFVDVYTVASGATEIQLALNDHELSASVVDVAASKITYIAADTTDPDHPVSRESVGAALARLDGSDSVTGSVAKKVKDAVDALDAVADSTKTAIDGSTDRTAANSGVFALQAITEANGKITSMTAVEVDAAGSAATVLGTSNDTASDNTVYGAKAAAAAAQTDVDNLETLVGTGYGTHTEGAETVNNTVKYYIDNSIANGLSWGTF